MTDYKAEYERCKTIFRQLMEEEMFIGLCKEGEYLGEIQVGEHFCEFCFGRTLTNTPEGLHLAHTDDCPVKAIMEILGMRDITDY